MSSILSCLESLNYKGYPNGNPFYIPVPVENGVPDAPWQTRVWSRVLPADIHCLQTASQEQQTEEQLTSAHVRRARWAPARTYNIYYARALVG